MSSHHRPTAQQLPLFPLAVPAADAAPRHAGARRPSAGPGMRPAGRNARMAERLERMAADADREAAACRRAGDEVGVRRALERARDSRRAAALLRAGPSRVAEVLAS